MRAEARELGKEYRLVDDSGVVSHVRLRQVEGGWWEVCNDHGKLRLQPREVGDLRELLRLIVVDAS